jgi:predicted metalloprotease with PDZ domain
MFIISKLQNAPGNRQGAFQVQAVDTKVLGASFAQSEKPSLTRKESGPFQMTIHKTNAGLRIFSLSIFLLLLNVGAIAQNAKPLGSIKYYLSMSEPKTHLFEVRMEVELRGNAAPDSIEFQMPKWSPGRYASFDFAKNVQEVRGIAGVCPSRSDCSAPSLPVRRVDDQTWSVKATGLKGVTISYKVYGNDLSGTFSQLNEKHANYNGGSIFMYIAGHKQDPVELTINPPESWRIVNGRMDRDNQREWQFPNYDIMIDTPTEIGPDWTMDKFEVDGRQYRVVVHSLGNEGGRRPALVMDFEKIVRAETAMWGPPEFQSYTFLVHFAADDRSGDGMEHLTSTQLIQPGALADQGMYDEALDAASHEFFHVWNVKRLRPVGLGPWDFTRDARTEGLWFAEGFTNYYGHMMLRRAGIWKNDQLLQELGQIIGRVENSPGTRLMSAVESSLSAPFIDGAASAQRTNLSNTSISYYYKGEMIALVLDSMIRKQTRGRASLDDVMRRMYTEFYLKSPNDSYYLRGRGYTVDDVEKVVSEVAGTDMHEFFMRYVHGVERLPYEEALAGIGLSLITTPSQNQLLGGVIANGGGGQPVKVWSVKSGSPAQAAGISEGDEIVEVGTVKAMSASLNTLSAKYKQGETVPVTLRRNRETIRTTVTLTAPNSFTYKLEAVNDSPSAVRELRDAWFTGSR